MWVIEGQFDGLDEQNRTKRKVLYPGQKYPLGRNADTLRLMPKVVSGEHAYIIVGPHPVSDADDPSVIPKLEYTQNNQKKAAGLERAGEDQVDVSPNRTVELKDGDIVRLSKGPTLVSFHWIAVNVLIRSGVSRDERTSLVQSLAKLGIKSTRVWSPAITHVVFASVAFPYDFKVLTSLVHGTYFVSPAWLHYVAQHADAPHVQPDDDDIETYAGTFSGLEEAEFCPDAAGLAAWRPNPQRSTLFQGLKFVLLTVTDAPQDLNNVVNGGGGDLSLHQILPDDETTLADWSSKLQNLRRKSDRKKRPGMECSLVLLGDTNALQEEVGARWEEVYTQGVKAAGLRIVWLPELSNALLKNDLAHIDCATSPTSSILGTQSTHADILPTEVPPRRRTRASSREPSLPQAIPSTHPSEPSLKPSQDSVASKRLNRRVTKQSTPAEIPVERPKEVVIDDLPLPQPAPSEADDEVVEVPPPRKTILKRRATARRAASNEPPAITAPSPATSDTSVGRAPRGLKRRVTGRAATAAAEGTVNSVSFQSISEEPEEPPHKKFKALFEGTQEPSVPEAENNSANIGTSSSMSISTNTGPSRVTQRSRNKAHTLMDIDEEAEENVDPDTKPKDPSRATQSLKTPVPFGSSKNSGGRSQSQSQTLDSSSGGSHNRGSQTNENHAKSGNVSQQSQSYVESQAPSYNRPEIPLSIKKATGGGAINNSRKEPDKEPQFLQALASRTKTKAKEDDFDREFNQLRIAVPDKHKVEDQDQIARELAVWKELEHDPSVRGNFMIVEYSDLLRSDHQRVQRQPMAHWNGVPNFKKFKKKNLGPRTAKVALELPPPVDFGMGETYWQRDDENTTISTEPPVMVTVPNHPIAGPSTRPHQPVVKRQPIHVSTDEASDEEPAPRPPVKGRRKETKKPAPIIDLHLSEDDEPDEIRDKGKRGVVNLDVSAVAEDDDELMPFGSNTLKSTGSKRRSQRSVPPSTGPSQSQRHAATKRKAVYADNSDDDDDDDSLAFKGFGKRVKR